MASKTVTGVDMALVNLKSGGTALVPRGDDLPDGLADGETKRLTDLGVFTEPKLETTTAAAADTSAATDNRIADLEAQLAAERQARETAEKAATEATSAAAKGGSGS